MGARIRRPETALARYRREELRRSQTWVATRALTVQAEVSHVEHGKMPLDLELWATAYGMFKRGRPDTERLARAIEDSRDGWDLPLFRCAMRDGAAVEVMRVEFSPERKEGAG